LPGRNREPSPSLFSLFPSLFHFTVLAIWKGKKGQEMPPGLTGIQRRSVLLPPAAFIASVVVALAVVGLLAVRAGLDEVAWAKP
jgi:hypothetical protein